MSTHTAGPWEVATAGLTDEGVRFVINGAGDAICRLQSRPLGEEMPANARLIAAAPKLLEALMAAKRMIDEALPKFNWEDSALDANAIRLLNEVPITVNAAIAKAKGQA